MSSLDLCQIFSSKKEAVEASLQILEMATAGAVHSAGGMVAA